LIGSYARREILEEISTRNGTERTYEQSCDMAAEVMADALWVVANKELTELVTEDDEFDIDGIRYRRLEQHSPAVYFGRWGSHEIDEPLYRQIGVHNGPTLKPIELRAGIIARRMTLGLGRIVGKLGADGTVARSYGRCRMPQL
jgi:hypothetical protein